MTLLHDTMNNDLLSTAGTDMRDVLEFMKKNGVPLTTNQVKGITLLSMLSDEYNDFNDLQQHILSFRPEMTSTKKYFETINKITLGDRIKGHAKLGNLLKASTSTPTVSGGEVK
jgi:hypothetical protein